MRILRHYGVLCGVSLIAALWGPVAGAERIRYTLLSDSFLYHMRKPRELPGGEIEPWASWSVPLGGSFVLEYWQRELAAGGKITDVHFWSLGEPQYEIRGKGDFGVGLGLDQSWTAEPPNEAGLEWRLRINEVWDVYFPGVPWSVYVVFPRIDMGVQFQDNDDVLLCSRPDCFWIRVDAVPIESEAKRFFRRGDVDGDGQRNIADPLCLLQFLFLGAGAPSCLDAADSNDDGQIDVSDAVFLLMHLFAGSRAPPLPTWFCGLDETEDELGCEGQPACMDRPE